MINYQQHVCDLLPAVEADTVCGSFSSESMNV